MRAIPTLILLALTLAACKDGLVEPERFGDLQGTVVDFETGAPLSGAGVSTSPATDAITTGGDGAFAIEDVLVGTYTITASRTGYTPNTVTVSIRNGRTAQATVFLRPVDTPPVAGAGFTADVLRFTNQAFTADSSFVTVEYQARNDGETAIGQYEVYFRVETDRGAFFQEIRGQNLGAGARDIGSFRKRLLGASAQTVVVEGSSTGAAPTTG